MLDHSLLLYGAGLSNPNVHSHIDLPLLVVAGKDFGVRGGRHLVCADATPMTNLLASLLEKAGVPLEKLGDSSGHVDLETLSGL